MIKDRCLFLDLDRLFGYVRTSDSFAAACELCVLAEAITLHTQKKGVVNRQQNLFKYRNYPRQYALLIGAGGGHFDHFDFRG